MNSWAVSTFNYCEECCYEHWSTLNDLLKRLSDRKKIMYLFTHVATTFLALDSYGYVHISSCLANKHIHSPN